MIFSTCYNEAFFTREQILDFMTIMLSIVEKELDVPVPKMTKI